MNKDDDNSIFDELDDRLDDFFSEEDTEDDDTAEFLSDDFFLDMDSSEVDIFETYSPEILVQEIKTENNTKSPLDSLKAIVLEMDWEINDENLSKYLDEINSLQQSFIGDRAIYLLLKLHNAIGKYMFHKRAGADPDALKFLYKIYNSLERVMTTNPSVYEKNKIVLDEITNFKHLKMRMFPGKYAPGRRPRVVEKKTEKPDFSNLPEDIQREINEYIEHEISLKIDALKKELTRS